MDLIRIAENVARLTLAVLVSAVALGLGPQIARAVQAGLDRPNANAE